MDLHVGARLANLTGTYARATLRAVTDWMPSDIPDLRGKTALVTGANSGIGFEAARALAARGASVVLGCRDPERGRAALERMRSEAPGASLELLALDLASQPQIREAAARFLDAHARLDLLCNNAGVMAIPRSETEDGFEMQLGVNHFGHFALTGLLLERLLASGPARVVTVSSTMHRVGVMRFDDLDGRARYREWDAYAQSKLANLLFAYELQRRLAKRGSQAISVACHPGYAATNLQEVSARERGSRLWSALFRAGNALFAQSAEGGAWPTLYAATSPEVKGGDYIGPSGLFERAGAPAHVRSTEASHDPEAADRLWRISVERTGVSYAALE